MFDDRYDSNCPNSIAEVNPFKITTPWLPWRKIACGEARESVLFIDQISTRFIRALLTCCHCWRGIVVGSWRTHLPTLGEIGKVILQ